MRVDKYLKNSRLIKRRTIAKEACDHDRVMVNNKLAKAGTEVDLGDIIHIEFGNNSVTVKVMNVAESVRKEYATDMYEVID